MQQLAQAVDSGGTGLIALDGQRGMQAAKTDPLADLMPVRFDAPRGQSRDVRFVPTPAGLDQAFGESPATTQAATDRKPASASGGSLSSEWARLPPIAATVALGALKPTTEPFATTPAGDPLIAAMTVGK